MQPRGLYESLVTQALVELLQQLSHALVTAGNPASNPLLADGNHAARLREEVEALGHRVLSDVRIGEDATRESQESLVILDISRGKAQALGLAYGQLAVVFGEAGARPELVSCEPGVLTGDA